MAPPTDHGTGPVTPVRGRATTPPERVPNPRALSKNRFRIALTDGDVILYFHCPPPAETKEIIVSAKVLAEASPVFREILASDPQGQLSRSDETPQLVNVKDWTHFSGLAWLCQILHGRKDKIMRRNHDGSLSLLSFAQVARGYRVVAFLKPVISYSLLAPFVPRASGRDRATFRTDTELAMIAYLLDLGQLLKLFTRRLIMDHRSRLSACHYDLFEVIPAKAILQLEEQRSTAQWKINCALRSLSTPHCKVCESSKHDSGLLVAIGKKLNPPVLTWPPDYLLHHTIRDVLGAIASLDDYDIFGGDFNAICDEHPNEPRTAEQVHECCKDIAEYVSREVNGLCFWCVMHGRGNLPRDSRCKHRDESLHELDPIT
ncbi:hypothetical protein MBLNU13_g07380t1 [Cladosporium sp. NU13]